MTMKMFVEDWKFGGVLGEGAFGEVKLLINVNTNAKVAVKMINLRKNKDAHMMVKKEIYIQKTLNHENVLKLYGSRQEDDVLMMFLEYAIGGELFDRIEPDVGMPSGQAQYYMKQLLNGVQYLHQKGIAHRDIKPENLLIDENDVLKICDFGLATMFRLKGRERLLDKRCGTLPYVAPEVISEESYHAEPADTWSCGIVLICMLCGEAPFNQATTECSYYKQWITGNYMLTSPWTKLQYSALNLLKKVLLPNPKKRISIPQILEHSWINSTLDYKAENGLSVLLMFVLWKFSVMVLFYGIIKLDYQSINVSKIVVSICDDQSLYKEPLLKRLIYEDTFDGPNLSYSQPTPRIPSIDMKEVINLLRDKSGSNLCYSQPTHNEDLMINSQLPLTQTQNINMDTFQCMVKRMTRFFVKEDWEKVLEILAAALDQFHYTWNMDASGVITISTVDTRKMPLVFKINLIEMDSKLLLDFRLSKGCGLEFKRRFIKLKHVLRDVIDKEVTVPL